MVPELPAGLGFGVGVGWEGAVDDSPWRPYWQPPKVRRIIRAATFISMRHDFVRRTQGFGRRSHTLGIRRRHPLLPNGALGLCPVLVGFALGSTVLLIEFVGQRRDVFLFSH